MCFFATFFSKKSIDDDIGGLEKGTRKFHHIREKKRPEIQRCIEISELK